MIGERVMAKEQRGSAGGEEREREREGERERERERERGGNEKKEGSAISLTLRHTKQDLKTFQFLKLLLKKNKKIKHVPLSFIAISLSNGTPPEYVDILILVFVRHVVEYARLVDVDGGATVPCAKAIHFVVVHGCSFSHQIHQLHFSPQQA